MVQPVIWELTDKDSFSEGFKQTPRVLRGTLVELSSYILGPLMEDIESPGMKDELENIGHGMLLGLLDPVDELKLSNIGIQMKKVSA